MMQMLTIAFLFLLCWPNGLFPSDHPPKRMHLYLLMGQSNMAGRGELDSAAASQHDNRVWMLNQDQQWVPARHPIHFDKPDISGSGLGLQFGIDMADSDPDVTIGLVPCAVGGTAISRWEPGQYDEATKTHPYDDAQQRLRRAMEDGEVKGILWHQGEADSFDSLAGAYTGKFLELLERVRKEVGNPDIPVVVGQLGMYNASYEIINRELARLPSMDPHIALVSSEGLTHKGDGVHFNRASLSEFGKRYAKGMIGLQQAKEPGFIKRLRDGQAQHIVVYGTSLSSGGNGHAWMGRVAAELNRQYCDTLLRYSLAGKGGMWSTWGVQKLDDSVLARRPDAVFIEFGMNDAFADYKTPPEVARLNLEYMIDRIQLANPSCDIMLQVMNMPIGKSASLRLALNDYYDMYRQVARERGLLLIDHYPNWQAVLDKGEDFFRNYVPDGLHPNDKGAQEIIAPYILKTLTSP